MRCIMVCIYSLDIHLTRLDWDWTCMSGELSDMSKENPSGCACFKAEVEGEA